MRARWSPRQPRGRGASMRSEQSETNRLIRTILDKGNGITLTQIADAHAIARERAKSEPDAGLLRFLERRAGLHTQPDSPAEPARPDQLELEGMT
jgi:hypothetical protein